MVIFSSKGYKLQCCKNGHTLNHVCKTEGAFILLIYLFIYFYLIVLINLIYSLMGSNSVQIWKRESFPGCAILNRECLSGVHCNGAH